MGLGCGASMARIFLIVFNIIFFLLGGACLGVGIWVLVDKKTLFTLTKVDSLNTGDVDVPSLLESAAYALITGGAAVFVIGFLGCCGAIKKSKCLLIMYAVLVGLIFVIELVAGILAVVFKDDVESKLKTYLQKSIDQKYDGLLNNTGDPYNLAWNFLQIKFACCGVNSYSDFNNATNFQKHVTNYYGSTNAKLPLTCCKLKTIPDFPDFVPGITDFVDAATCLNTPSATNSNYMKGCYDEVWMEIKSKSSILIGVGIGIGLVELLGVIFACCLCRAVDDED